MNTDSQNSTLNNIRNFLLILFVMGQLGTAAELLLIGHTEDYWQWLPLVLMALSLLVLGGYAVAKNSISLKIFQGIMVLLIISGFVGLYLHYEGNVEFEMEMYPSMAGWELFWKAIKGTTPPTLAPGMMMMLGFLGMAYTYQHPVLQSAVKNSPQYKED